MTRRAAPANRGPYAVLFDTGFYSTAFGPAMPFLALSLGVSLSTAGLLLSALFAGSITASSLVAGALHRANQRQVAFAGLALICVGLAGIGLSPNWPLAVASSLALGVGDGLTVAAAHMLVAAVGGDLPRAMSRLNIVFAFGAASGPIWAGALFAAGAGRGAVYVGMLAVPILVAIVLAGDRTAAPRLEARTPAPATVPKSAGMIFGMGALLLFYVGCEIGLGTWVSSYTKSAFGAGVMTGALVTAGYWAALGAGRIAGNWVLAKWRDPVRLLALSIAGAFAASLLLSLASGIFVMGAAGALLAGFCFGPIWPCALGLASQDASPRVPAILVTVGNAGGLFLPLLQGAVLDGVGPRAGMAMTAALCILMAAALQAANSGRQRTTVIRSV